MHLLKCALAAALAAAAVASTPSPAAAAPVPSNIPTSWYMDTVSTGTHDNLGCRQADAIDNAAGAQYDRLFLLYGSPIYTEFSPGVFRYGATVYQGASASVGQVTTALKAFVNGYARCIADRTSQTSVSMSVSNFSDTGPQMAVGYGHGVAWAEGVRQVREHISNNGYSSFIDVDGGGDLELEYATPADTRGWVDGFNTTQNFQRMYNFGSSSGCPETDGDYGDCVTPGYRWYQESVHYINYGASAAMSFPQNYTENGKSSRQRKGLKKRYGTYYSGVLTQRAACTQTGGCIYGDNNSASAGYTQLYDILNADPATAQSLNDASDFRWCYSLQKSTGYCG